MSSIHEDDSISGEQVLPFYIVCDESASMSSNGGIDAINSALPELHEKIASNPLVNDKARIALIAFSDDAEVLLPLSAAADVEDMPGVMPKGATNYGSAFRLLKTQIATDIATPVHRPTQEGQPAVLLHSWRATDPPKCTCAHTWAVVVLHWPRI